MKKILLFAAFSFLVVVSCRHEPLIPQPIQNGGTNNGGSTGSTGTCDPDTVYFQQQVLPILVSNCTMSGCHDESSRRDGVVLTTYANVMNTAGIRPGNARESELYEVLVDDDPDDRMPRPPAAPLTAEQKNLIYKWIQQGAKNLSCQTACDVSAAVTFSGTIKPLLASKCSGCHGGAAPQAGIYLTSYNSVKSKVADGRLWGAVNHQPGFSPMPKNGAKLSACELGQLKKWIDAGSPNN